MCWMDMQGRTVIAGKSLPAECRSVHTSILIRSGGTERVT